MQRAIFICLLVCACFAQSPCVPGRFRNWPRLPEAGISWRPPAWQWMPATTPTFSIAVRIPSWSSQPMARLCVVGRWIIRSVPIPSVSMQKGISGQPTMARTQSLKMDRQGRIVLVLGRYRNSSESQGMTGPPVGGALRGMRDENRRPFQRAPRIRRWLRTGTFFVADGYGNSRVVKFNKDGSSSRSGASVAVARRVSTRGTPSSSTRKSRAGGRPGN